VGTKTWFAEAVLNHSYKQMEKNMAERVRDEEAH
jgi:hypothetical protein